MLSDNRIIWKDNATLRDLSQALSDYNSDGQVIDYVSAEDAIYLGSDLPFNHRYLEVSVVNALPATVAVEIWDGNSWVAAVDVLDETAVGGATLARSGIISWVTPRDKSWGKEDTTENVDDLTSLRIYDMYWVRLKFSADLTPATALKYVGHKFSKDSDLFSEYAVLSRASMMTAVKAGKTDWHEQTIVAAEYIVADVRERNRNVVSSAQIFNWQMFNKASVHRTAEIAFSNFGEDYEDDRVKAGDYYKAAMNQPSYGVDSDGDGHVDLEDRTGTTEFRRV